jgi:hypothetical protein
VSLKERLPKGSKQAILRPAVHNIGAQLASSPGVPKKCKKRVPVFRRKHPSS